MASVSGTRGFSAMRLSILGSYERRLAQGAAIIILGGLASGCSSDAMRFSYGSDGMFTGATSNQRQIIAPNQAYPGDSRYRPPRSTARIPARLPAGRSSRSISRHRRSAARLWRRSPEPRSPRPIRSRWSRSRTRAWRRLRRAASIHRDRHREAASAHRRRGRSDRLVARRRHPGDRQGRRDRSTICRAASACRPTC